MSGLILPCESDPQWGEAIAGTPFFRTCQCDCWFAAVYVVTGQSIPGAHCTPGGSVGFAYYSIRSVQAPGSTLTLPIHINYYIAPGGGGCGSTAVSSLTKDLKVGRDTGGEWVRLGTLPLPSGDVVHVYLNSFNPRYTGLSAGGFRFPEYCGPVEWAVPISFGHTAFDGTLPALLSDMVTPGPIKWRDVVAMASADLGYDIYNGNTPGINGVGNGVIINNAICDPPPTTAVYPLSGGACKLNAYGDTSNRKRSFNRAVYVTPSSPLTTDDTFTLVVTFYNPFTGELVDGTHVFDDPQELDIDTPPGFDFTTSLGLNESIQWASVTRLSFGVYQLNGAHFHAHKGIRRFRAYGDYQFGSFKPVTHYKIESGDVDLRAGVAAYVDCTHPPFSTLPFRFKVNQVISFSGVYPTGEVLDGLGDAEVYNVVDGATNTVDTALLNGAGNAILAPVLNGTTSQAAVAGVATFNDLTVYGLGRNYDVDFSSSGLAQSHNHNFHSFPVEIVIDLAFEALPTFHAGVGGSIKVDLVDALGALVSPDTINSLTLSGAGSFTGFGTVAPVAGVATFTGNFPAAGTYTIQVVTSGTTYDGPGTGGIPAITINVTVLP